MSGRFLVVTALLLTACDALPPVHFGPPGTSETHLVVNVRRADRFTLDAWKLHSVVDSGGLTSDDTLPHEDRATPISFPTQYVVVGRALTDFAVVNVEALDQQGHVVGRGSGSARVEPQHGATVEVTLEHACSSDGECSDGKFCTGPERCADGICHDGEPPCGNNVRCATSTCSEADGGVCMTEVDHTLCPPLPDGGPRYCDPVSGCSPGIGCQPGHDDTCGDGFICNGDEVCVGYQCVQGDPFNATDDDPCTIDACVEPTGRKNIDVADGTECVTDGGPGICVRHACAPSTCGDRYVDTAAAEVCDDGSDNSNDTCADCKPVGWEASVLFGFGDHAGRADRVQLVSPSGVASGPSGSLFIADGNRIWKREGAAGPVRLFAGAEEPGFAGDGDTPARARFNRIAGLFVRGDLLLVVDAGNHRIRRISAGHVSTVAGVGEAGRGGDDGPPFLAHLSSPSDVTMDLAGNIYIADTGNNVIRKISGNTITTVVGTGMSGFGGDDGNALQAQLASPGAVMVDRNGDIWISDTGNNRVRRVDAAGLITTVAGNGLSSGNAMGMGRLAVVSGPGGLAEGAAETFVTTRDHRILRIDRNGLVMPIAGNGMPGASGDDGPAPMASLNAPTFLAAAPMGELVVSDSGNNRVRSIIPGMPPTMRATVGLLGPVYAGYGSAPLTARLLDPISVVTDTQGRILIAERDGHRIRRIDVDGTITTIAGTGEAGFSGDGHAATSAKLRAPSGIALGDDGSIYISDSGNHRVRRVSVDGNIATIAGTGVPGYRAMDEDHDASSAPLNAPMGLAVDGAGNLFIADSLNARVRRIDAAGHITTVASAPLVLPAAVAVTMDGTLYIADEGAHRVWAVDGGAVFAVAGTGDASSGVDGPATMTALLAPGGVAVDGDSLLIAEAGGNLVRRLGMDGALTTVAGTGAGDFWGDSSRAVDAHVRAPRGLAVDGAGGILIADSGNGLVRRVRPDGVMTTVAGTVHPGDGPFETARLKDAHAVARIAPGKLLVADGSGGRVRLVDTAARTVTTVAGYPHGVASGLRSAIGSRFLDGAAGIAFNEADHVVYVSERGRHLIHRISLQDIDDPATWTISVFAGADGAGARVDGTLAQARFRGPTGLAFDGMRRILVVTEAGAHDVRAIRVDETSSDTCVTTIANQSGLEGNSMEMDVALVGHLSKPMAVAAAVDGAVFVADTGNNRIRRIGADGRFRPVVGSGGLGSAGVGHPAWMFTASLPRGLTFDVFGNLFAGAEQSVRIVNRLPDNDVVAGLLEEEMLPLYGSPKNEFPHNTAECVTGISVDTAGTPVRVVDACTGMMVELRRVPAP